MMSTNGTDENCFLCVQCWDKERETCWFTSKAATEQLRSTLLISRGIMVLVVTLSQGCLFPAGSMMHVDLAAVAGFLQKTDGSFSSEREDHYGDTGNVRSAYRAMKDFVMKVAESLIGPKN